MTSSSKRLYICTLAVLALVLEYNHLYAGTPEFDSQIDMGLLEYPPINEASGVAVSRKNSDVLWTHNDKGDSNRVFACNSQGKHLGVYSIGGATNRDWEDIAVGPGPVSGQQYLYVGEIGDNSAKYDLKHIYRVPEAFEIFDRKNELVKLNRMIQAGSDN